MYKVCLVDDEINILEGIAAIVDWKKCRTKLSMKAHNGVMAFDAILEDPPDIVMTDIKMPGMNGIELIKKVHERFPGIKFIVLSGYDEFEYAKTAMECNVRHYLLKPSNEVKIEKALCEITEELDQLNAREQLMVDMREQIKEIMPIAKEQFLKDFLTSKKYGEEDWEYFSRLFDLDSTTRKFRLLLAVPDDQLEFEHLLALKEWLQQKLQEHVPVFLSTVTSGRAVFLLEAEDEHRLLEELETIKAQFADVYHKTFTSAISGRGTMKEIHHLYNEGVDCLAQRFYLEGNSIITPSDLPHKGRLENLQHDHEELLVSIRSGDTEGVKSHLQSFFRAAADDKYESNLFKSHCVELFVLIVRQAYTDQLDQYMRRIVELQQLAQFEEIRQFIEEIAVEITNQYYEEAKQSQNHLLNKITAYVDAHLSDPDLSLAKIANEVFYMNPDYLGKLFKKEKGERFSNYLIDCRMTKAIEMIREAEEVMVFEVAEAVGFGNNPRYFGQVFKKHTGYTPRDYKKAKRG